MPSALRVALNTHKDALPITTSAHPNTNCIWRAVMTMNRIRLSILFSMLLTLAVCTGSVALYAQTSTQGSIAGTVMDPSGAVVGGATVLIHNMGTNAEITLTADTSGFYKAPLLEPGTYSVTFTAPGFAAYHADNVIVQVGQVTSIEPRLTVGASSASVEVVEQAPVMNLESPDFSDMLNVRALETIPINNRRWSSLAMTTPGVVSDANGYGLVSVRGISPLLNNVEIDGADDNQAFFSEERGRTREAYSTSGGAVREFAVNTGVYSAEYGRAAGGVITSVTKSGTNQLHGQAYFWDRESNWAAFNDYSERPELINGVNTSVHFKPEDLRKIYGFTVGGALIKDKLFWIYTYDQHTHVFPADGVPYNQAIYYTKPTPTAALMPAGESCNAANGQLTVAAGTTVGSINDNDVCTLAARQQISYDQAAYDWTSMIYGSSSVTAGTGVTSISDLGLNSDIGVVARMGYQEINMPKVDYQLNPNEHISLLYNRLRWDSPGGVQTNPVDEYARDSQGNDYVKLDYGVAKLTSLITTNIGNELLYQYSRENDNEGQQPFTPYTLANLQASTGNIPQVSPSYYDGFSAGAMYYDFRKAYPLERKWQINDVLYYNRGNHSLKFGIDAVHNYDLENDLYQSNGAFRYNYLGNFMNDELNFKNGVTPSATNVMGCDRYQSENAVYKSGFQTVTGDYPCYYSFGQGFGTPTLAISTMDTGVFGQDNWKFSPRLTLELGLRWDYEALPTPFSNLTAPATLDGVTFNPYPGLTNSPSDKMNFGPRVGFSYDVFGKGNTVLRGGFGMYYGRITNGNLLQALTGTGSPHGQITPSWSATTAGAPQFPNILAGNTNSITPTSYFLSPNLRNPMVEEYDLMVQQAIGHGTYIELSYLGALGRELPNYLDVNLDPTTMVTDTITISDASGLGPLKNGATYQVPTYTKFGNQGLFGSVATQFQNITEMVSNINSNYNAGVIEVTNRSLHSIQFDANYTWSHALDFAQNALTQGGVNDWYDPYGNARVNYGNSSYNVPDRFVGYALYNLPNLHTTNWVKYLTNDWSLDESFQAQSGLPYTAGIAGAETSSKFADWNGSSGSTVIPAIGRNTYKYPRKMVDDMRVQKEIAFERGRNLQLMLNVFNVANHQNVDGYETTSAYYLSHGTATYQGQTGTSNSGFGVINSSNNSSFLYTPRQVEIAARFSF
jgi:hypothetical protein